MRLPAPLLCPHALRTGARRAAPGLGVVLAAGLLAGCGGSGPGAAPSSGTTPTTSPSSSTTPVAPLTPAPSSTPVASASASPRPAGLAGRLIGADQVPAFADVSSWTVQATGPAGPEPAGACQEYDFATIGARSAEVRSFAPASGGQSSTAAAERVVAFPDATNAARALKVLESFRDRCQARVHAQLPGLRVGALRQVNVPAGTAWAYTATWRPTDGSAGTHTEEVGTVLRGKLIAVVTFEADTTPPRQDPMPAALAAAAGLLG